MVDCKRTDRAASLGVSALWALPSGFSVNGSSCFCSDEMIAFCSKLLSCLSVRFSSFQKYQTTNLTGSVHCTLSALTKDETLSRVLALIYSGSSGHRSVVMMENLNPNSIVQATMVCSITTVKSGWVACWDQTGVDVDVCPWRCCEVTAFFPSCAA